jgi:Predicted nucleoside-diphosphate sugar epimerases
MCPRDSSHLTYEFKKYYLIKPDIIFFSSSKNYEKNLLGEVGKKVKPKYECSSNKNCHLVSPKELEKTTLAEST